MNSIAIISSKIHRTLLIRMKEYNISTAINDESPSAHINGKEILQSNTKHQSKYKQSGT